MTKQTATNEFRNIFNAYIMESVADEYAENVGSEAQNIAQIYGYIFDRLGDEFGYRIAQVGTASALCEWLQGLAIGVDFEYHKIIEVGKKWGFIGANASDWHEDMFCEAWFKMTAKNIILFAELEGVEF